MTEAALVLNQTNHERKVAGYGAHHKKGGSAVAKLGNRPMSDQEIQSKHGECKEYDLGGFMDYETFKRMDPDLEVEYVNKLCEKYHVRHEHVSKWLFGLGENDLLARLKIKGVDKKVTKIKASDVTDDAVKDFCEQIDFWRQKTEAAKIIDLSEAQRKHDIIENAEFIEYDKFSSFTTDEKVLYLNSLIDKYGVSLAAIERELFKLPITNLRHKLDSAGVLKQIKRGKNGFNAAKANKDFCDALKNWRGESTLEENPEPIAKTVKGVPETIARDILAEIVGENDPMEPMREKPELPESNISAVYIPVEQKTIEEPAVEQPDISAEEMLDKRIEDLGKKIAPDPVVSMDDIFKQVGLPKINLEFTAPAVKETPKPSSEVYFSTRYISEKGLDRETILNKIYLLASLFENEENLEITLTVATKKEA